MIAASNLMPHEERAYDDMVNEEPPTRYFTILGRDFELDELKDIVSHGMSGGVSGFIYTRENVDIFDKHDDEIQDYLSDWVYDNIGNDESSFKYFAPNCEDISQLKSQLVWCFVELKAHEILIEVDPNY